MKSPFGTRKVFNVAYMYIKCLTSVAVRKTSLRVGGFLNEFEHMAWGRSGNPSKQDYNPTIHRRFRGSKIHGYNANTEGPQ